MEGLTGKLNTSKILRAVDVALLAYERVPPEPGLKPDLVAAAGHEADLNQRGVVEGLEHLIVAARLARPRVARVRFFLDERSPGPRRGDRARCHARGDGTP